MFQFSFLEDAFSALEEIGKARMTFMVKGIPVTMRIVTPEEEIEVHKFSKEAFGNQEDGEEEGHQTLDFFDRLRVGTLSYAIIGMGDQDFEDENFVATGEVLKNGVAVKMPIFEAVRGIIRKKFSKTLRALLYKKYFELSAQAEKEAEETIEFEPSDLDAEIQVLKEKIQLLEDKKELFLEEKRRETGFTEEEQEEETPSSEETEEEAPQEEAPQEEAPKKPRVPFLPRTVPPPVSTNKPEAFITGGSFLGEEEDPQLAVERENQRLWEARQKRAPHMEAAQIEQELGQEQQRVLRQSRVVEGKEVFDTPPQILERPLLQSVNPAAPVPIVNPIGQGGRTNPRFRSPTKE